LDLKLVREGAACRYRALCDTGWAIHPSGAVLEETVPVETGADMRELVLDVYNDSIALVSFDGRTWVLSYEGVSTAFKTLTVVLLTIHDQHLAIEAVRSSFSRRDGPVVLSSRRLIGNLEVGGERELFKTGLNEVMGTAALGVGRNKGECKKCA
jgi:hypothetical protein